MPLSSNSNTNLKSNEKTLNQPSLLKCRDRPTVNRHLLLGSELSPLNISNDSPSDNLSSFTAIACQTPPSSSLAIIEPSTVVKASFDLSDNPDNWNNRYIFHLFKHYQKKVFQAQI